MNEHIIQYTHTWVNKILGKYEERVGSIIPPVCEKTLCRIVEELQAVKIILEPDEDSSFFDQGLLIPVRGGFIIKYGSLAKDQKKLHNVKIRETICHELSHILFYDCTRVIPELKTTPPEYLCHDAERQLLLPDRIVKERFAEKVKANLSLIHVIEEMSREFRVAVMLMVKKIIEDLALQNDTMVTIWKYKPPKYSRGENEISYKLYRHDPKLSPQLRELLPKYWRDQVHIEAWKKVVSKAAIGEETNLPVTLHIEGKKRIKAGIKNIHFEIQCKPVLDRPKNLRFAWGKHIEPSQSIISIKKFNLRMLVNGK